MIAALRRRLQLLSDPEARESGLSLVELLVAMLLFSFLLTMTMGFFVSASRANTEDLQIDSTNRSASTGMDELARVIRGATTNAVAGQQNPNAAFVTAGDNTITLYSEINLSGSTAQPEQVQFSVVGKNLVETIWQPMSSGGYFTFSSTPSSSRVLAGPLVLPASGAPNLFTYISSAGTTLPTTGGLLPTSSIGSIAAVQVQLQVGAANNSQQSTLISNIVGLPNLSVSRNPS